MPALQVGDLIEIKAYSTLFAQRIITTFPQRVAYASTGVDTLNLSKLIGDYWQVGDVSPFQRFLACIPQNMTVNQIGVQKVWPARYREMFSPVGLPGTDANDATTANTSGSIERACELSGRDMVGRISIPGVAPANQVDGFISAALKAKMVEVATRLDNQWSNGTLVDATLLLEPVLIHREKVPPTPEGHWTITGADRVITAFVKDEVRTQRSRTIGKGI